MEIKIMQLEKDSGLLTYRFPDMTMANLVKSMANLQSELNFPVIELAYLYA